MDQLLTFPITLVRKEKIYHVLLGVTAVAGAVIAFPLSFVTQSNLLIGTCLLPFVANISSGKRFNYLFFLLMLFFGTVAFIYGIRMCYFFTLVFYSFWLAEIFLGRINSLTVFLLGFMSPFFLQISVILGFPIRLQISQLAGILLKWAGLNVRIEGNMMLLDGAVFSVDEACMGLSMMAISMLMGVFILSHYGRASNKTLNLKYTSLFFATCFALNLIANLFRIVLLVLFKILPENPMHEVIGICCLVVYVLAPLYVLGRWMVNRFGHQTKDRSDRIWVNGIGKILLAICAMIILLVGIKVNWIKTQSVVAHSGVSLHGFTNMEIGDGVTKLTNETILIYVKRIPEFFSAEHTPLLCWKGSGYAFQSIGRNVIAGREIYFGQLVKTNARLYTAWWYSNGKEQTISQLDWRMSMLKGESKFCLVNVTANNETELVYNIKMMFENNLLKINN